jgi:hypothetical protein
MKPAMLISVTPLYQSASSASWLVELVEAAVALTMVAFLHDDIMILLLLLLLV